MTSIWPIIPTLFSVHLASCCSQNCAGILASPLVRVVISMQWQYHRLILSCEYSYSRTTNLKRTVLEFKAIWFLAYLHYVMSLLLYSLYNVTLMMIMIIAIHHPWSYWIKSHHCWSRHWAIIGVVSIVTVTVKMDNLMLPLVTLKENFKIILICRYWWH